MSIDLNGSATGLDYATTYKEEDPAIRVVSSDLRVGGGSSIINTDLISMIRVAADGARPGDQWQLAALPAYIFASTSPGGQALTPPVTLDAVAYPYIYLTSGNTTDTGWQEALKSIRFYSAETPSGYRTISFEATNVFGITQPKVQTSIQVMSWNDTPTANPDHGTAIEAGGVANSTPGANATGNVLANDSDDGHTSALRVTTIAHGGMTVSAGIAMNGTYGTLTLQEGGSYIYVVNDNNAVVQSLRTSANTLTEVFTYTVRDAAGATSNATLSITIQGANDTLTGQSDTLHALEAGGVNNSIPGTNPSINLLLNDTDVDANDTKQVTSWSGNHSPYGTAIAYVSGGFYFTVNNTNAAVYP